MQNRAVAAVPLSVVTVHVFVLIEDCYFDPGVELDVAPEIEPVGHMVDVTQDLGLRAVALGPMPILLQLVREGIRVLHALDIAATPRVTVPVPSAANPTTRFKGTHLEAKLTQTINCVETPDSGAEHDRIKIRGFE